MLAVPSQAPGVRERCGLTQAQADHSAWAFDQAGGRFEGAAAINRAVREVPGLPGALARLYGLPVVTGLEDIGYRLVARVRGGLSALTRTRPECDEPGVDCG